MEVITLPAFSIKIEKFLARSIFAPHLFLFSSVLCSGTTQLFLLLDGTHDLCVKVCALAMSSTGDFLKRASSKASAPAVLLLLGVLDTTIQD